MTIIKEFFNTRPDGIDLYRTYSDAGVTILQNETGIEYSEAIDVEDAPYTYLETENPIEGAEKEFITREEYNKLLNKVDEQNKALEIAFGGIEDDIIE